MNGIHEVSGSIPLGSTTLRLRLRAAGHPSVAKGGLPREGDIGVGVSPEAHRSVGRPGPDVSYVYFLELKNGDVYVGSTSDLKRRYRSHQNGDVQSTKAYCPVLLRAYVAVETNDRARALERYFKSGSGKAITLKRFS